MRAFTALLIGLSAATLTAAAVAESFNDRSPQPTAAESTVAAEPQVVMAESDHFNDRGADYTVTPLTSSGRIAHMAVLEDHTHFNMK